MSTEQWRRDDGIEFLSAYDDVSGALLDSELVITAPCRRDGRVPHARSVQSGEIGRVPPGENVKTL